MKTILVTLLVLLFLTAIFARKQDDDVGLFTNEENMESDVETFTNLIRTLPGGAATLEAAGLHAGHDHGESHSLMKLSPLAKKLVEQQKLKLAKQFGKLKKHFIVNPKPSKNGKLPGSKYAVSSVQPMSNVVPAGYKRYRCKLDSHFQGQLIEIHRWCLVNKKTGDVVIQQEPSPNKESSDYMRSQETGIIRAGPSLEKDIEKVTAKSSSVTTILSMALIVLTTILALF